MVGDTFRIPTSLTSSFRVPSYTKSDTVRVSSVRSFLPAFFRSGNVTYNYYVVVHHQPTNQKKQEKRVLFSHSSSSRITHPLFFDDRCCTGSKPLATVSHTEAFKGTTTVCCTSSWIWIKKKKQSNEKQKKQF